MSGAWLRRRSSGVFTVLAATLLCLSCQAYGADRATLLVSAASSLDPALRDIAEAFEAQTGIVVLLNFGASGRLVQQIEQGAPVDVFASADTSFLDVLSGAGLVERGSRRVFARGYLAVWPAPDGPPLMRLEDLASPAVRRVAMAHPRHAPYGRAARRALEAAGLWPGIESRIIVAESVEQAFQYAEAGHVDAALVAKSVLPAEAGQSVPVPDALYAAPSHELAVMRDAPNPLAARRFAAFMVGSEARRILEKYGLVPVDAGTIP